MSKSKSKITIFRRRGSVLLQTLIMCIVLSYIAVNLTQWVLSRFTSSSKLHDNTAGTNMLNAKQNVVFSCGAVTLQTGNITGCTESSNLVNSGIDSSVSGVYSSSWEEGSGANKTRNYTFDAYFY